MKKIGLCAVLLASGAALAAGGTVVKDSPLRSKPRLDAKAGAELDSGTRIEILGSQGGWLEVRTEQGDRGWLRLMNVRPGESKRWTEKVAANVGSVGAVVRTAATDSTATTGIRGISKQELENATPNFDEVKRLDQFQVSAAEARKFAGESKIRSQKVAVLKEQDESARP